MLLLPTSYAPAHEATALLLLLLPHQQYVFHVTPLPASLPLCSSSSSRSGGSSSGTFKLMPAVHARAPHKAACMAPLQMLLCMP
jgi:hypothetical protein